jgi:hypothetical protein
MRKNHLIECERDQSRAIEYRVCPLDIPDRELKDASKCYNVVFSHHFHLWRYRDQGDEELALTRVLFSSVVTGK